MPATRPLIVLPGPPPAGRLRPPGDKSITHRAYLLGLLAEGETLVEDPNAGEDCLATLECARVLGAGVETAPRTVRLRGTGGTLTEPGRVLDCGNSGTTLRLLAGVLAGQPFEATLTGDASLCRRPMGRVIDPLRRMGASLSGREGDRLPPVTMRGGPLSGVSFSEATPSAQVASAILLAGTQAQGTTTVVTSWGVRDHTARMLRCFGVPLQQRGRDDGSVEVSLLGPVRLRGCTVRVPGDFSAGAFFLAAAAATPGASVTLEGVGLNPTRAGLLDVLEHMGARVRIAGARDEAGEPVGDVTLTGPERLEPFDVPADWMPRLVDEVPAWAIAASAARGTSRIAGAAELRLKESDRLRALAAGLEALGIEVTETSDGLVVTGGPVAGGRVVTHGDHRIAMAFALMGTRASGAVTLDDAASIATSYPGFLDALQALGGRVGQSGEGTAA